MPQSLEKTKFEVSQLPAQTLAYIGDAVFELHVREQLIARFGREPARGLHFRAIHIVRASAQAQLFTALESVLEEDELSIYHRARNAKIDSVPKSADIIDYRMATGLEAVIGYLYLSKDENRLHDILSLASQHIWEEK